jgi:membrane protein YdbS with pleckstrin-like domain
VDHPLGTLDDVHITAEDRRLHHLMSLQVLTAAEEMELDALSNKFVTDLNDQVNAIAF